MPVSGRQNRFKTTYKIAGIAGPNGIVIPNTTGSNVGLTVGAVEGGTYYVGISGDGTGNRGLYYLYATQNDVPSNPSAPTISVGRTYRSYINRGGDADW